MPRPKSTLLTDREAEIMTVLWELGSASAEEVRSRISGNPHDSTVRTLLRVLVAKRHVAAASRARPTLYRPLVRRGSMQKRATRELLKRFFGGSAEQLILHLLDDDRLSLEQIKQLEQTFRADARTEKDQ
ncbi:MAG TPA: BlaI/MecI/CopY family transcriptional regulator [Pirellulales bacterium]|nr:BlaI/MecI/CopY family transcriptional regulator [Pirellulales bacterium]